MFGIRFEATAALSAFVQAAGSVVASTEPWGYRADQAGEARLER